MKITELSLVWVSLATDILGQTTIEHHSGPPPTVVREAIATAELFRVTTEKYWLNMDN